MIIFLSSFTLYSQGGDPMNIRINHYFKGMAESDVFEKSIDFRSVSFGFGQQYDGIIVEYELDYCPPIQYFQGENLETFLGFSIGVGYSFFKSKRIQFPILAKVGGYKYQFRNFKDTSAANFFAAVKPSARLYFSDKFAVEASILAMHAGFGKINDQDLEGRISGTALAYSVGFISFFNL